MGTWKSLFYKTNAAHLGGEGGAVSTFTGELLAMFIPTEVMNLFVLMGTSSRGNIIYSQHHLYSMLH